MLIKLLKNIFEPAAPDSGGVGTAPAESVPADELQFLQDHHSRCDIGAHLEVLFRGAQVGGVDFLPLYRQGLAESGTEVKAWKGLRRPQAALNLLRYFDYSLAIPGARVECGVFLGLTAWLMCKVASRRNEAFRGEGLHLVDSFEGFPPAHEGDAIAQRDGAQIVRKPAFSPGDASAPLDHVRALLRAYPSAAIHKGWIPAVFRELPPVQWSFVHVDVDLYEPTLACLQYFVPKLAPGGVVICDDYGTPLFPGAGKAWRWYCREHGIPFAMLDTGQAVIMSPQPRPSAD